MKREELEDLLNAWDRLNTAAARISTSLPQVMTQSAATLETERLAFRDVLNRVVVRNLEITK